MDIFHPFAWLYWDPHREAFIIPFTDHPVAWYGILFVTGFILAYFVFHPILTRFLIQIPHFSQLNVKDWTGLIEELRASPSPLVSQLMTQFDSLTHQKLKQPNLPSLTSDLQQGVLRGFNHLLKLDVVKQKDLEQVLHHSLVSPKEIAYLLTDRLCWFVVAGTIIGARLGDVFFYNWSHFRHHPLEIFKIWHGGLASHGGVLGVVLALYLYLKYIQKWIPQLTFLTLLDFVAIPSALVACFIRLGNFMNQEILGIPTDLPWGVVFGHPAENVPPFPRHPVQLYEAGAYLITFFVLWNYGKISICKKSLED